VVIRFLEALAAATPGPTERADPPAPLSELSTAGPRPAGESTDPRADCVGRGGEQQQPPLGLRPLEFAVHDRHVELLEAIQRYRQADYTVPIAWEQELAAVRWCRDLLRFTAANGRPL